MRFKQFLKEDASRREPHAIVEVRPVTEQELHLIKQSKELARILWRHAKKDAKLTIEDVKYLRDTLAKFEDFKFLSFTIKKLDEFLTAHQKMVDGPEHIKKNLDKMKSSYNDLRSAFLSGNKKVARENHESLTKIISKADANIDAPQKAKHHMQGVYRNSFTIFGTTRLLHELGEHEYQKIGEIDTNEPLFTPLDFPFKKLKDDWDYIVAFLLHLTDENEPVKIESTSDFRLFIRLKHSDDKKFEELLELTSNYLRGNQKQLIPQIVELIEKIPTVKAANDKRKQKIKTVYRGIGLYEDEETGVMPTEEEVIEEDRKSKYVATSDSLYSAKDFALQKGHLEGEDSRRSKSGYIIEYEVGPEAILFDTKVIDTVYNESEILIDATKALVKEVKEV